MYTLDRLWYMYTNVLWTDYGTCIQMYCGQVSIFQLNYSFISSCNLWNNMSNEMRESTSLEIFKTKYLTKERL
jgi:hypothetical protein